MFGDAITTCLERVEEEHGFEFANDWETCQDFEADQCGMTCNAPAACTGDQCNAFGVSVDLA